MSVLLALLPPANEVWGKVIFSQACVKNSVHRGGLVQGGCSRGGCLLWGALLLGGGAWSRGGVPGAARMATAAGGTHPTGMHSCSNNNFEQ